MHSMFPPGSHDLLGHLKGVEWEGQEHKPSRLCRQPHAGCPEHFPAHSHIVHSLRAEQHWRPSYTLQAQVGSIHSHSPTKHYPRAHCVHRTQRLELHVLQRL
uniref:Uncharacterized protein n=1 Tax=Mustela putorius furo TaxID=9669 RepID=M3YUW4_MUSPF